MEWLKTVRIAASMTQEQVANKAQISQPAYTNIEKGYRNPSIKTAKKIAAVLGFDWQRFYDESPQNNTPEA